MNIPTVLSLFDVFVLRMLTVTVHMYSVTVMVRSIIDSPAMSAPRVVLLVAPLPLSLIVFTVLCRQCIAGGLHYRRPLPASDSNLGLVRSSGLPLRNIPTVRSWSHKRHCALHPVCLSVFPSITKRSVSAEVLSAAAKPHKNSHLKTLATASDHSTSSEMMLLDRSHMTSY